MGTLITDKKDENINSILKAIFAIYILKGFTKFHKAVKKINNNKENISSILRKNPGLKEDVDNIFNSIKENNQTKDKNARIAYLNQTFPNIKTIQDFVTNFSNPTFIRNMQHIYNSVTKKNSQEKE